VLELPLHISLTAVVDGVKPPKIIAEVLSDPAPPAPDRPVLKSATSTQETPFQSSLRDT